MKLFKSECRYSYAIARSVGFGGSFWHLRLSKISEQMAFRATLDAIKIGSVFLEKRIFFILSMHFRYFVIISSWKRVGPFIWTNLNSLHPRILCTTLGWNWPMVLEKKIFYFVNVFSLFRNYLPLEKGRALYLNKLKGRGWPRFLLPGKIGGV